MNKKDFKMIAYLRADARMPLTKMSKKTCIPVSTLFDRLRATEKEFIVKHTSLLDFTKLGYHSRANVAIKVKVEDKDKVKEYLKKNEMVNSVYRINNGYDFMFEAVFRQVKELEEFLENMERMFQIDEKKTFYILEDLKRECFMSDPSLVMMGVKEV